MVLLKIEGDLVNVEEIATITIQSEGNENREWYVVVACKHAVTGKHVGHAYIYYKVNTHNVESKAEAEAMRDKIVKAIDIACQYHQSDKLIVIDANTDNPGEEPTFYHNQTTEPQDTINPVVAKTQESIRRGKHMVRMLWQKVKSYCRYRKNEYGWEIGKWNTAVSIRWYTNCVLRFYGIKFDSKYNTICFGRLEIRIWKPKFMWDGNIMGFTRDTSKTKKVNSNT